MKKSIGPTFAVALAMVGPSIYFIKMFIIYAFPRSQSIFIDFSTDYILAFWASYVLVQLGILYIFAAVIINMFTYIVIYYTFRKISLLGFFVVVSTIFLFFVYVYGVSPLDVGWMLAFLVSSIGYYLCYAVAKWQNQKKTGAVR